MTRDCVHTIVGTSRYSAATQHFVIAQDADADATEDCFPFPAEVQQFSAALSRPGAGLHGSLGLFGVNAASDGIEDGQLCLLNRRNGIVNGEARLPLKPFGSVFRAPCLSLSFSQGQRLDVGGDFRFKCLPVPGGGILDGLYLLIHLFRCSRRSSVCLLSTPP